MYAIPSWLTPLLAHTCEFKIPPAALPRLMMVQSPRHPPSLHPLPPAYVPKAPLPFRLSLHASSLPPSASLAFRSLQLSSPEGGARSVIRQ